MDIQDKAFKEWFAQYDNNIEYASEKISWDAWKEAKAQADQKVKLLLCDEHLKKCESPTGIFNSQYPDEEPCLICLAKEAKAQAVPAKLVLELEKGRFKEYEFKALLRQSLRASKVTRSKLNWVHVMSMLGTGSTVAHRICEALGVNPDGTEFKAQEPAND